MYELEKKMKGWDGDLGPLIIIVGVFIIGDGKH